MPNHILKAAVLLLLLNYFAYAKKEKEFKDFEVISSHSIILDKKNFIIWENRDQSREIQRTWEESLNYCNRIKLANFEDWRLPSYNELESIIDYKAKRPMTYKEFTFIIGAKYWSSTTNASRNSYAWFIDFSNAKDSSFFKGERAYSFCMRNYDLVDLRIIQDEIRILKEKEAEKLKSQEQDNSTTEATNN